MPGPSIFHIRNHPELAIRRLPAQFRNSPNLRKLVKIVANRYQGLEDVLWSILQSRTLSGASGAQLDNLGAIVGQPRNGMSDATYLLFIKVRILLNRSSGTGDEILTVFRTLGPDLIVSLREEFPAAFALVLHGPFPTGLTAQTALALCEAAKAAGVRCVVEFDDEDPAGTFTYDGMADQAYDVGLYAGAVASS